MICVVNSCSNFILKGQGSLVQGQSYELGPEQSPDSGGLCYRGDFDTVAGLRAGAFLRGSQLQLKVLDKFWGSDAGEMGRLLIRVMPEMDFTLNGGQDFKIIRQGFSLAWITLSDKGAAGAREDQSGPLIQEIVGTHLDLSLSRGFIIPDDFNLLKSLMVQLALTSGFDLIITTGGTGLGPRDITPEAAASVMDKRLPGFEQAMMAFSLTKTPHAMISRAAAGTLGWSVIINLPGSPKGVRENLQVVMPSLKHALKKLQGDKSDCAAG